MTSNGTQIAQVLGYRALGWPVIDIPYREKNPQRAGWQDELLSETQLTERFANGPKNVGLLLGIGPDADRDRDGIVDVDLDDRIAVAIATHYLPITQAIFGRRGKPASHYLYRMATPAKTSKWVDPVAPKDSNTLVEIRSRGAYTVIPDSWHKESGEAIQWVQNANFHKGLSVVTWEQLEPALNLIASITLLARHWRVRGSRHDAALYLAGGLCSAGWDETDVIDLVSTICQVTGDEDEVARQDRTLAVRTTFERAGKGERIKGFPSLSEVMPVQIVNSVRFWLGASTTGANRSLNDAGNADRLLERHHNDIRYHASANHWLIWNGMNWETDDGNAIVHRARDVQAVITEEASHQTDPKTQQEYHRFAVQSNNRSRLEGMVALAASDPSALVRTDDLDQHPWKFNCANGTLDLETMSFYPNRREDYITLRSPVRYDARPDLFKPWEAFLDEITDGDRDRKQLLQRAAGYTMTGSTEEEVFFFAFGPEATGKTTFLEAIRMVMGGYAQALNPETLLMGRTSGSGGPRPDLAKLRGARYVTAVEIDEGRRMAAALVKQLTGGDYISARFLHQNEIEFRPDLKLWIAANDTPYASSTDGAMKRRFVRIPFDHHIPLEKRDTKLKTMLSDPQVAGPTVLAWVIEGYRMWRTEGLGVTRVRAVIESNRQFWDSMDPLRGFLSECCIVDEKESEFAGDLRAEYVRWAKDQSVHIINDTEWGKQLRAHGFTDAWKARKRAWRGLKINMNRHQLVDMTDREENISAD